MPIPLLVGALAVAAGAFGVKKGVDARSDNKRAEELYAEAEEIFEEAKNEMEDTREQTSQALAELGMLKLNVWDNQFGRFVDLVEKVRSIMNP